MVIVADPAKRAPKHRAAFAQEVSRDVKRQKSDGRTTTKRSFPSATPALVLESWEAVDEVSGERVAGGASASGVVLLLRLRSAASSSTLSAKWP